MLEARCAVCHGCYDAPCQVVLTSPEGAARGASKEVVYDGDRLLPIEPSRLFVDEKTTEGWRKRDFFPVLPTARGDTGSLAGLMLQLGAAHSFAPGEKLPQKVELEITRELTCAKQDEFADYIEDHPLGGMPYGTAPLSANELDLLSSWLDAGAPLDRPTPPLPARAAEQVSAWESFLNGASLKERITARYLYEHWFLAHLYFDDLPTGPFFRVVRSRTPPGTPVDEIATRRPYDDPESDPFWYRLRRIEGTIVHKTHTLYEIGDAKKARLTELFLDSAWEPTAFPSYEATPASNPFVTYVEVPAQARYRYFLDDAQYFVMTFIRGPVCRGQIATNVIEDHFFVAFLDPEHDLSVTDPSFLPEVKDDLNLPAEHLSRLVPGEFFVQYGLEQRAYLDRREASYAAADPEGPGLDSIWDGDGTNTNALLTVFRHWDNATVVRGWQGAYPKTAWVLDYPIFERIYYDLVAGFDVFGNVAHQAATRLYMDHLRMQGENVFLSYLPRDSREAVHASWYVGATQSLDYKYVDALRDTARGTRVPFPPDSADPKKVLIDLILEKNRAVAGPADDINRCDAPPCVRSGADALERRAEAILQTIAARTGPWVGMLPEVTRLRVHDGDAAIAYTLVHNRAHTNVAYMFDEEERLVPADDTLTVVRGYLGSYPNFAFDVSVEQLPAFRDQLVAVATPDALERLAAGYGVRRTSPSFWSMMDWMNQDFASRRPTAHGLFDLGRYENL